MFYMQIDDAQSQLCYQKPCFKLFCGGFTSKPIPLTTVSRVQYIYIYIYIYIIYIYKHKYIYIQLYVILYYIYIVYIYVNVSNIYIVTNSASDFKQLYLYRIQKNKRFYLKEFHNWQRRLVIEVKNSCLRVLHFTKNEDLSSHAIF